MVNLLLGPDQMHHGSRIGAHCALRDAEGACPVKAADVGSVISCDVLEPHLFARGGRSGGCAAGPTAPKSQGDTVTRTSR